MPAYSAVPAPITSSKSTTESVAVSSVGVALIADADKDSNRMGVFISTTGVACKVGFSAATAAMPLGTGETIYLPAGGNVTIYAKASASCTVAVEQVKGY